MHGWGDISQVLLRRCLSVYVGAEMKWQLALCLLVATPQPQPSNEDCGVCGNVLEQNYPIHWKGIYITKLHTSLV